VNNVGTNIRKPSIDFTAADYSTIFTTNLESAFSLSQLFHPLLKAADSSVLLFNSSVAGECAAKRLLSGSSLGVQNQGVCDPGCSQELAKLAGCSSEVAWPTAPAAANTQLLSCRLCIEWTLQHLKCNCVHMQVAPLHCSVAACMP
jgi:NAD(P)-dependent dehydrogenase (short-subunit alcohol dehydrogenase family)